MATTVEHKNKWLHNRAFLGTIEDRYADWITTVMFYTALHAVETLFAFDGTRSYGGHMVRNRTLKITHRYKQVWRNYQPLYDAARAARYDPEPIAWVPLDDIKTKLAPFLYRVEISVLKLTGANEKLPPIWS